MTFPSKRKSEHLRKQSLISKRQRGNHGQVIKCMPQNHEQENKEDNKENSPPLSSNEQLQIEKENGDKGNENNTEESTKEVESKHPYFRRCKLGIGEARLVEPKLGSKKMEEEISYSCNYLKRLFKALNKTSPNFNNLELFQNRFHSILENGRQNAIDCMTKYEKSLAKLKNKDGKDKFSNLLSSLTLPYLRVALKLEGKSDYGKKEDLINRIKDCYPGGILQFGRALQANKVTDKNVNDIYESFH